MKGEYVIVGDTGAKAYDFEGNKGVSRKISIRNLVGEVIQVKAVVDYPWQQHLDKKVVILFEVKQGGVLKAVSVDIK